MKQFANLSILFCILLMAGCRTAKSMQKEETRVENRVEVFDSTVLHSYADSLYRQMVLSVDSLCVEVTPMTFDTDTSKSNTKPQHRVQLRAYGIRLNTTQEHKNKERKLSDIRKMKTSDLQKTKISINQRARPKSKSAWAFICLALLLIAYIVYCIRKK